MLDSIADRWQAESYQIHGTRHIRVSRISRVANPSVCHHYVVLLTQAAEGKRRRAERRLDRVKLPFLPSFLPSFPPVGWGHGKVKHRGSA